MSPTVAVGDWLRNVQEDRSHEPRPDEPRARRARPRRIRRWTGPTVAAMLLVAWCVLHLRTSTSWPDLVGWIGAVGVGVVVPGTAVVRALRRGAAPLVEDLAWGSAAGCLVALLGWLADRLLPWSPGPLVIGPIVVAGLLAPSATRRRILARPAPGWGPWASLAAGFCVAVSLIWMATTSLIALPADPGPAGILYTPDTLFQNALVGEFRGHLSPQYPFVDGEPLKYHWFLHAILAHLTTGTGVDPFGASLRLAPTTLVPAVLLVAGVVARRLSGRVAAAPVAMVLVAVVEVTLANRWGFKGAGYFLGGAYTPIIGFWRSSPTQTLGWLAGIAALGATVAWLRRDPDDRAVPVALLLPFFALCLGSKSSQLPVLVAGVGLAMLVALVLRRWDQALRALALAIAAAVLWFLASVLLYRGGTYGVVVAPGERPDLLVAQLFPKFGRTTAPLAAYATAMLVTMAPMLTRLLGLTWLMARRSKDPAMWVTTGAGIAGFVAFFVCRHPA